jgi:hypothetical protein
LEWNLPISKRNRCAIKHNPGIAAAGCALLSNAWDSSNGR